MGYNDSYTTIKVEALNPKNSKIGEKLDEMAVWGKGAEIEERGTVEGKKKKPGGRRRRLCVLIYVSSLAATFKTKNVIVKSYTTPFH